MRALVTGGAGFIGSALANQLLKQGHEVIILDDLSGGRPITSASVPVLVKDIVEIRRFEPQSKIDWVFHFAAHFANTKSLADPMENVRVNMLGTMAVLDFCVRNDIKRLMYASSSGVYGAKEGVAYAEDMPPKPITPYEVTKYSAEIYAMDTATCTGFRFWLLASLMCMVQEICRALFVV